MPVNSLKNTLIRDEGLRLKAYVDTRGKTTIGYGRNLTDAGISYVEAEYLLDRDIARITAEVFQLLPWIRNLDEVRQGALLNLAFNVGPHGLLEFRAMLAAAQAGNWPLAAIELLNSVYHQELAARSERLAKQLETGVWV